MNQLKFLLIQLQNTFLIQSFGKGWILVSNFFAVYWSPRRSRCSQRCKLSGLLLWPWLVYYFLALPARESQLQFIFMTWKLVLLGRSAKKVLKVNKSQQKSTEVRKILKSPENLRIPKKCIKSSKLKNVQQRRQKSKKSRN